MHPDPDRSTPGSAAGPTRTARTRRGRVVVLDGGLATQLEAQGNDLSDPLWSARVLVESPDEIRRAHLAFFRAGARVATTASYQATFEGFAARGIAHDDAAALLRRSVELADEARTVRRAELARDDEEPLLVAASVGPYGAMFADGSEYRGRYGLSVAELRAFHAERMAVLAATAADLLALETIPELEEAVALVDVLAETAGADGRPASAWLSFSCADGGRLRSGAPIEEAVAVGDASPGIVAIGVNCTAPEHVEELLARAASATSKPLVAYPNSGEGWDARARSWTTAEDRTGGRRHARAGAFDPAAARRWVATGATFVGGCCRVTPDDIADLAAALVPE